MSEFEKWKEWFERSPEEFRANQQAEKIFIFDKAVIRFAEAPELYVWL